MQCVDSKVSEFMTFNSRRLLVEILLIVTIMIAHSVAFAAEP